jgi:outer membrane protein insertion porin family
MPRGAQEKITLRPSVWGEHEAMQPKVWSRRNSTTPVTRALGALALSAIALCRAAAAPEPAIVVEGNRRIDAQDIRAHFPETKAAPLTQGAIDGALKELYATGLFEDVKIIPSGTRLIVRVVEAPVIERVRFEGNKLVKDSDLTKEIALKPHGPMTKTAVREDVARITEIYHRSGRYDVQVTPNTIARGDGRVDLVFEIKEGAKTGVTHIAFVGNGAFGDSRLKAVIKTSESGWFGFLKTSDVYDPDRVQVDLDLLRRFYVKNGFADVHVSSAGAYDPDQHGFTVTFTINEGARYRFGAIDIQSRVAKLEGSGLRDAVRLAQGDVYNGEALDKAVDAITVAAGKRGFPFVDVRPHAERDPAAKTISVVFALEDGPRRYVERIDIHGNTRTYDEVIRREFDIAEGDAYNRGLIDAAERRLKQLPPFKSVKITTEPGSAPDRVVLNVDVEEQPTGDLAFSGGYSTAYGIIGEVGVSERNFLGLGQYVKASVGLGQYLRSGSVSFVEPYLLGNRLSLGLDLFYRDVLPNPTQSYGGQTYGASIKVGAPLMDGVTSEARYSLVNQSVALNPALMACVPPNATATCPSVAIKQAVLNGPQWVSTVGSTLAYSTLDNPKNPHEGLRATLSQDVAGVPGTVDFLRTTGDVRYYHDLGNDVVGSLRAQGGYMTPYGGQTLPLLSSFFGGPQLVRGFAINGFGPRDVTAGTTMDNIGGSRYWTTSAELQSPIPGLPPEIGLKTAVFADAGSLWGYKGAKSFPGLSQSFTVADSKTVRSSVGSSLIWDSPFGPLRVDYAYPVSKASGDITQRLHFGVGAF